MITITPQFAVLQDGWICAADGDHVHRRPGQIMAVLPVASRAAWVLVVMLLFLGWGSGFAAQDVFHVSNGSLEIGVSRERGELVRLADTHTRQNFTGAAPAGAGLWELVLTPARKVLSPADAHSFRCQLLRGKAPAMRLTWDGFGLAAAPGLRVEAVARLEPKQPMSRWELTVSGLGELGIGQARFPRLVNIPRQSNERLAVPVWMGQQTAEPRKVFAADGGSGRRQEWAYPGILSMQCMAFYRQDGPGLYLACDDTAAFNKSFAFFGDGKGRLGCEVVHLPEGQQASGAGWRMPYAVCLGTFEGDWFAAAERYRAWATNQVWAKESRLARGQVSDWALDTALWVWNRGRSPGVLAPAVALREKLGLPVSVFWHWWHGCSYDAGFPEYLPPREGTENFTRALAKAQAADIHALVYMNQRLWGMTTRSWTNEGAERFAVKGEDGRVHPEVYNTFTRQACATMCMGTDFWRQKYAGLAERAVGELGVDGIYMDQACTSRACYDPQHGHSVGGGVYWMQGFRALESGIRQRCAARGEPVVLAGEGCGEPWLPYLDLMLSLQVSRERYAAPDGWETIPFWPAVYHPFAVAYGNYSSLTMPPYDDLWPVQSAPAEPLKLLDRKYSRQFCLEQARAFVWGQQPTIANFLPEQLAERAEEVDFVLRLARLRSRARKYLLHGTFLRPPQVRGPSATLDMSRLSIYAGREGGLTAFQTSSPLVLACAWAAPDRSVGIAVASIADEPIQCILDLPRGAYGLPRSAMLYQLDEADRRELGTLKKAGSSIQLDLPPRAARILELAPQRK
ncbi:MAG TPA: DUF6259 domain-containing protein [Candidatus Paceibacterota bacterium]|nr:DUF6259 domain-containing protein [Verrucomicrobiota bacterium]HSA11662.1 DUF6259 domain-containing protein [Candidatus Paceibacterota bacterium]